MDSLKPPVLHTQCPGNKLPDPILSKHGLYHPRMSLYIGKKAGSSPWLRFKIQYYGDDWVFLEKYLIYIDGQKHIFTPPVAPKRDNYGGNVWEENDLIVTEEIKQIIKKVISSKETIIRYISRNKGFDYKITSLEKNALKNVIDGYEALGGKF